jgi:hypothetical protein
VSSWVGSLIPMAVRVKNARFDGMVTGFLHKEPTCKFGDPGGMISGKIILDQWLGYRSDIIMPYSRIYFYNKLNGDVIFEGDTSHPGRSASEDGSLIEVNIEGGVARMSDWSGPRIWADSDMTPWTKSSLSVVATNVQAGDDRGGSSADALTLAFPSDQHVELNSRCEAGYLRIREAGQEIGRFNYRWDGGHTSGSPGWLVRSIVTPPSTLVRNQVLNVGGSGISGAVTGISYPDGANVLYLQLIWTSGSSSTGSAGADIVWASIMDLQIVARLKTKSGAFIAGANYNDYIRADQVWEDMLGTELLNASFDGPNAQIDLGTGFQIQQLAYPDGVTPQQVADELMKFEQGCTYLVGASNVINDKYSIKWMSRSELPRYEFMTWVDAYDGGAQEVDQFDTAVARWRSPNGLIKQTVTTQSIPEMTAVGRSRRIYQDLSETTSSANNAAQANTVLLNDHRFPSNGGSLTVSRVVVDLYTGRRVQPWEIQPGYIARVSGVNPNRDALNSSPRNGSTLCRIVTNEYDGGAHAAKLNLDSEPWSMFRAIAAANARKTPPQRRAATL